MRANGSEEHFAADRLSLAGEMLRPFLSRPALKTIENHAVFSLPAWLRALPTRQHRIGGGLPGRANATIRSPAAAGSVRQVRLRTASMWFNPLIYRVLFV
jgi:hypothetical protein